MDVLERLLDKISDDYDKTKGAFAFDFSQTAAIELEKMYKDIEHIIDLGFAETSSGADLDKICYEKDVYRHPALASYGTITVTGEIGTVIPAGTAWGSDNLFFINTKEYILDKSPMDIDVICQSSGICGNVPSGAIKNYPKTIQGLISVTNKQPFKNGSDEETDESLRERYYITVRTPATSGNVYHYLKWAREVDGVGGAKIYPLERGNGTVVIRIVNANKTGADDTLIQKVKEHIEKVRPIGADVTVLSAEELKVNINLNVIFDETVSAVEKTKADIIKSITELFKEISFKSQIVSYAKVLNAVFDVKGVSDIKEMTINNTKDFLTLGKNQIPIIGDVTFV